MDTTDARSQLDHCSTQRSEVYDTVAYMSIPATIFLLPFAMFLEKPVPGQWPEVFGTEDATDWQILRQVMHIAPGTFSLFVLSGVSGSPTCRGAWETLRMEGSCLWKGRLVFKLLALGEPFRVLPRYNIVQFSIVHTLSPRGSQATQDAAGEVCHRLWREL